VRAVILSLLFVFGTSFAQDDVRFVAVDIYLNSPTPVAAWQFELNDANGVMKIVGVENGDSDAYPRAPYYDREAVQLGTADRIVVADFSMGDDEELPNGRFRIATLHLMLMGADQPDFELNLVVATTRDGQAIEASISLELPRGNER